ncbi:MAG TPA: ROK family transcriptional regulator [Jiangellales bacterium]|nr:ROK family transcriptional regulator [Jiangellales bacterium]
MVGLAGATQEEVRRHNLAAVLSLVHTRGALSRAELTGELGVNRSTIRALVAELAAAGLVREELPVAGRSAAGRPSHLVVPESRRVTVLAVEVGVDHLTVARVGLGGLVLDRRDLAHERGGHTLDAVVDVVARLCAELGPDGPSVPSDVAVAAIGVGVPGVVRSSDGLVRFAPNLGWRDEPFGARLSVATGLPVRAGNDADLGVLAEHSRGAAVGYDDVLYLAGEVGVGGGMIVGGRLLVGAGGYAGEVGHLRLSERGRRCRCGARGCWETEIGENALLVPAGRLPGGGLAAVREVIGAARLGEPAASDALTEVASWLGTGLGALVNVLNPAMVVLGGVLAEVFGAAEMTVRKALAESAIDAAAEQVRLTLPALGADSVLLGAAELAFTDLLADPVPQPLVIKRPRPEPAT